MTRFQHKSVCVTGAGSGIGYALCKAFAREGATVALNDVDPQLADSASEKLNQELGRNCISAYGGDVGNVDFLVHMIHDFSEKQGGLDIMVANAGITIYGEFLDYQPSDLEKLLKVNLGGSFFSAQLAAKEMIRFQKKGRILLMSSVTGVQALKNLTAYGMTKAAIRMLARSLALELGDHGITVNAIGPGATLTERTEVFEDYESGWQKVAPSGLAAQVSDIAHAALFLASDEARHITGHTLMVDGGWTVTSPVPDGDV